MNKVMMVIIAGLVLTGCDRSATFTDIPGNGKTTTSSVKYSCSSTEALKKYRLPT